MKMRYYRLTESRVKRIIRHPARIEEGILENAIGVMQPAYGNGQGSSNKFGRPAEGRRKYSEIWAMYVVVDDAVPSVLRFQNTTRPETGAPLTRKLSRLDLSGGLAQHPTRRSRLLSGHHADASPDGFETTIPRLHQSPFWNRGKKKIKVITAWRYPGRSPERDPVPEEVLREVRKLL